MADTITPAAIVESLSARYPACRERAQRAAQLYTSKAVQPLPRSRTLRDDRWEVGATVCSIAGKYCNCQDSASVPTHNGGPLCEHRIAAMMYERLGAPEEEAPAPIESSAVERLAAIFAEATRLNVPQVRLRVKVDMTWNRDTEQANTCEGYLLAGDDRVWQALEASAQLAEMRGTPAAFSFTLAELGEAMDRHGWQFGTKNRTTGGGAAVRFGISGWINEIWYILPQQERDQKLNPYLRTHIGAVAA